MRAYINLTTRFTIRLGKEEDGGRKKKTRRIQKHLQGTPPEVGVFFFSYFPGAGV
jgi:hypothetical protein